MVYVFCLTENTINFVSHKNDAKWMVGKTKALTAKKENMNIVNEATPLHNINIKFFSISHEINKKKYSFFCCC